MKYILLIMSFFPLLAYGQNVSGTIMDTDKSPIPGVNIYWKSGKIGTTSDSKGVFSIQKENKKQMLIFSSVGYQNDTLRIDNQKQIELILQTGTILREVEISERKASSSISSLEIMGIQNISDETFQRAACCTLSESFETNASVDVSFTDAISGSRQIKMLGLNGRYVQLMTENIPNLRGLALSHGLDYIPGSWMESIQISKGAASVVNGFEAVTGQINTEYKKPDGEEYLYVNLLASSKGKQEGNFNIRTGIGERLSTMIFAHYDRNSIEIDKNEDGFMDLPLNEQFNFFNRWKYKSKKLMAQFGLKIMSEKKASGQMKNLLDKEGIDSLYKVKINVDRYEVFYKSGYIFNRKNTSLGFLSNYIYHSTDSEYGSKQYQAVENSFYTNLIYQSYLGNLNHSYSTGISYIYDNIDKQVNTINQDVKEKIGGAFFQYTFDNQKNFSYILGIRLDNSSLYGTFYTPRAHLKYNFNDNNTVRMTFGKAYRRANVIAENSYLLANSRSILFVETLGQEKAWNFGLSYIKDIYLGDKRLRLVTDYFRTDFQNQIVLDLDADKSKILIYNLRGTSYSNSYQIEASIEPFKRMDMMIAAKYNDVKITQNDELLDKPLTKNIIGLMTLSYATNLKKWQFDYTLQYNGSSRLPQNYPQEGFEDGRTKDFFIMNFQVNKFYKRWNYYIGIENFMNYTQDRPILSADNPFGNDFDASMVWAPISGRKFYVGIKYRFNRKMNRNK